MATVSKKRLQSLATRTRVFFWVPLWEFWVSIKLLPCLQVYAFSFLTLCAVSWWFARSSHHLAGLQTPIAREAKLDIALQEAAATALGQREGTIIIMDPQTGRVRAVVNPEVAFANSFAPGSTIKPFVALAALRAGLIDQNSRSLCRVHYTHKDFATVCAHPRDLPPFNPAEAIAYSCNYYFGTLGERLDEDRLSETLGSFGFGRPTGMGDVHEARGTLLRGKLDPRNTLGEGPYLQATPIQLLTAYSALVNGGQLFTPGVAGAADFRVSRRSRLEIAPEHRSQVIEGLRGAVRFGTAKNAALDLPELYIFGKTGTSTPANGFRTQGWFVGFAAHPAGDGAPATSAVELGILVFLKRAHGAEAAALSRGVFEAYARAGTDTETGGRGEPGNSAGDDGISNNNSLSPRHHVSPPARLGVPVSGIRVHLVRENMTKQISLEEYVAGVVATEGSLEDQPEALKALAVAARTYALKNLGRHAAAGYDFCTTTHCQRFVSTANGIGSSAQAMTNRRALAAVHATTGVVLHDERGQTADAYFSASCGGATANIQTLWGVTAPAYLRGVPDQYCATMPHHSWTDMISAAELWQALRSDSRTDPGATLDDVSVTQRDASGRAESIAIAGPQHRTVSGWDFKIIVGRALGWNKLKSSRFEISRSGTDFVFRGSGFGHGLGLCQEGAHILAQRGASYPQILAKYFPGASVAERRDGETGRRGDTNRKPDSQTSLTTLAAPGNQGCAARPFPNAVRLRPGAEHSLSSSRGVRLLEDEAQPRSQNRLEPERHSLSALPSGKAAKDSEHERLFADLLWDHQARRGNRPATGPERPRPIFVPASGLAVILTADLPFSPFPLLRVSPSPRLSISSEHFRVSYPARTAQREAEGILKTLESARADLLQRVSSAGLSIAEPPTLDIFVNETTGDFVGHTGQPWWTAAATRGNRIEIQPVAVLLRRGVLLTTLRHELAHVIIETVSRGRSPRWLAEGMALFFAGEGPLIARYTPRVTMTVDQIDRKLGGAGTADEIRAAYAAAYREVSNLVRREGESSIWRRVAVS